MEKHRIDPEEGSATPAVLAAMAVLLTLSVAVVGLMSVHLAQVKTQAATDLAALAAARVPSTLLVRPPNVEIPCGLAKQVVDRAGARLADCRPDGVDIRVVVAKDGRFLGVPWSVTAKARAGPRGP